MDTVDPVASEFSPELAPAPFRPSARARPDHATSQNGLPLRFAGDVPLLPVVTPRREAAFIAKRGLDIILATIALLLLWPLLLLLAIAVKLTSRGPLLFGQVRTGLHGTPFTILKFRTMHAEQGDATGFAQTRPEDNRVTPFGRLLRRTSLDELPQLFNVLAGDMSIVGPRPHPVRMLAAGTDYDRLVPYYAMRHTVRPGLSGWAQANGLRGPTDSEPLARARIDHDIAYIQNFSLWLDLKTIWLTVRHELWRGNGI